MTKTVSEPNKAGESEDTISNDTKYYDIVTRVAEPLSDSVGPLSFGPNSEKPFSTTVIPQTRPGEIVRRLGGESSAEGFKGYELVSVLGEGGMGIVYKARQNGLNRFVALKMIRGGSHATRSMLERFQIEAEAVAKLDHPNVVRIYEIGESQGLPFFSLELLEGGSLADRLAGQPQPARAAAELMTTLAEGMHAAHKANIIHRDLKPQNIIFSADGAPKITDFGLAKKLNEEGQTVTGQVMGTPAYMAPEQAEGRTTEFGPATDVYALGVILYEMLVGRPPFQGVTPMSVIYDVVHKDPLSPSKIISKIPKDLETICLKCLQKEPAKRYPSAQALADDLKHYLKGEPIQARPASAWELSLKWIKRHPAGAGLTGLSAVVLIGLASAGVAYREYQHNQETNRIVQESKLHERLTKIQTEARDGVDDARQLLERGELGEAKTKVRLALQILKTENDFVAKTPDLLNVLKDTENLAQEIEQKVQEQKRLTATQDTFNQFRRDYDDALFQTLPFPGFIEPRPDVNARAMIQRALATYAADPIPPIGQEWTLAWKIKTPPANLRHDQVLQIQRRFFDLALLLSEYVAEPQKEETPQIAAQHALTLLEAVEPGLKKISPYYILKARYHQTLGEMDQANQAKAEQKRIEAGALTAMDYYLLGWESYRDGFLDKAAPWFQRALRKQPDLFWPRVLLGVCQVHAREFEDASSTFTLCLDLAGRDYTWLQVFRGHALIKQCQALRAELQADPGKNSGILVYEPGDLLKQALSDFSDALTLLKLQNDSHLLQALAIHLKQALEIDPNSMRAHTLLSQTYRLLADATMNPQQKSLYSQMADQEAKSGGQGEKGAK